MKNSLTAMIAAASLIAALLVFAVNVAGDFLIPTGKVAASAPSTAAKATPAAIPAQAAPPTKTTAATAAATATTDAEAFKKCKACHTATKGGKNKFGPNLWGVVDRAKASAVGYKYSAALGGLGGKWSAADLDAFLKAPKKFAPGTKMPFAGIKKAADRAAVIAFLRRRGGQPKP